MTTEQVPHTAMVRGERRHCSNGGIYINGEGGGTFMACPDCQRASRAGVTEGDDS